MKFVANCVGVEAEKAAAELQPGEVLLLENLRFHPEEKNGDKDFAEQLSKLGDVYVNDAFGTAHRAHASTAIIAKFFPKDRCFGNLLAKEIESINKVLNDNQKPVTAILGGAKVSSKIGVIENILDKVDHIIVGGGMTFTFVKALGGKIGNSLVEDDKLALALDLLAKAKAKNVTIHLPVDAIIADDFNNNANTQEVANVSLTFGQQVNISDILDIHRKNYVKAALKATGNNKTKAAQMLNLKSHQVLTNWIKELGLESI